MPPKAKKTNLKTKSAEKENEINDTFLPLQRILRERNKKVPIRYNDSISSLDNERTQNENLKPLSFWSKKLKDLESKNTLTKERKYELYEFNESDDSFSPKKKKKNPNKKYGAKKKKQYDLEVNLKKTHLKNKKIVTEQKCNKNFGQKNLILTKEKTKLAKKDKKLTHSSILTSTPATNKFNLINSSDFMFISPLLKLDEIQDQQQSNIDYKTPVKTKTKTLKEQKSLIKPHCSKVLRSRKINTE